MSVLHITKENFEQEVLKSDKPVLLDFFAVWCGPCKMVAPIVERLAERYDGRLKVCKVNVDEEFPIAATFGVQSIPTLVILSIVPFNVLSRVLTGIMTMLMYKRISVPLKKMIMR